MKFKNLTKKQVIIIITIIIMIVVAVLGGMLIYHQNEVKTARETCAKIVSRAKNAVKTLEKQLTNKQTLKALKIKESEVEDKKTVETLKKLTVKPDKSLVECKTDNINTLKQASTEDSNLTNIINKQVKSVKQAVTSVFDSKLKKQVKDAKQQLAEILKQANTLLESSKNRVADDNTRKALENKINSVKNLLDEKNTSVKKLSDARNDVQNAVNSVNVSIKKKQDADAKKVATANAIRRRATYSYPETNYAQDGNALNDPSCYFNNSCTRGGLTPEEEAKIDWSRYKNGCDIITGVCVLG